MNLESRRIVFIALFAIVGVVYASRLFYMQVIDDRWIERASEVAQKKIRIKPPRGIMYDRNGNKVVANKTYYNLMFVENRIKDLDTAALGELLNMSTDEITQRFEDIKRSLDRKTRDRKTGRDTVVNDYRRYLPYPFIKELNADEIAKIAVELSRFPGFYEEPISMRDYPYPNAGNIFGYLNEISGEELAAERSFYSMGDNVGRAGLERFYEKELRGQLGTRFFLSSARGKMVDNFADGKLDTPAVQAPPLHLSLDIDLQAYGEKLMQNKLGCIVALEPSTGEIIAMVSSPSFDPNLLVGTRNIKKNYKALYMDSLNPLYPRPLQAEYPPGSIFKVVQALIGLQEGVIDVNTSFPCNRSMVGCHNHPTAQNIQQAVQFSCNPYFYYQVRRVIQQGKDKNTFKDAAIGQEIWERYMHSFGLGVKPEVDLYGVRGGLIPNVAFYNRWYGEHRWAWSTIRSNSIGQGEVKITPLQMANIAAIVANKGYYYEPHVVKSIGDNGPLPIYKEKKYTMVDSIHFEPIQEGMRRVVNEAGGTARRARISDINVCGKTGTAENPHGKDHSVFMAFAPMEKPTIAIAVFIENSGFGGTWAAPVAALMIEKYIKGEIVDMAREEERILEANLLP